MQFAAGQGPFGVPGRKALHARAGGSQDAAHMEEEGLQAEE